MARPSGSCRSGASGGLRRAGRVAVLGLAAGLLGLGAPAAAGEGEDPKVTAKERLPVYAWFSVDPAQTSVERYRELAAAGFVVVGPRPGKDLLGGFSWRKWPTD